MCQHGAVSYRSGSTGSFSTGRVLQDDLRVGSVLEQVIGALMLQLQLFMYLSSCRERCLLPLQMALESKNTKLGQSALTGMQVVNQRDHSDVVGVK